PRGLEPSCRYPNATAPNTKRHPAAHGDRGESCSRPSGVDRNVGFERNQNRLLFAVENIDRYPASRSMDTAARCIPTPDQSAASDILQIDEGLTLEEALAHEAYGIFDDGLIFGMPWPCRVGQKAAVVGIFQKRPIEAWRAGVRFIQA